jgi:hypothetical protein
VAIQGKKSPVFKHLKDIDFFGDIAATTPRNRASMGLA